MKNTLKKRVMHQKCWVCYAFSINFLIFFMFLNVLSLRMNIKANMRSNIVFI